MKEFLYFTIFIIMISLVNLIHYRYPEVWIRFKNKSFLKGKSGGVYKRQEEIEFVNDVNCKRRKIRTRMFIMLLLYVLILVCQFIR